MIMNVIPIFKSHYSIGRSILTLEEPSEAQNKPKSIMDLALKSNLKEVFLVEDSISGFLQAYKNCQKSNLQLNFGLRITICPDISEKSPESLSKSCKYIIFAKSVEGYKRLIKIYSDAAKIGFYYEPRIDFASLKKNWSEADLMLVVPFYDSFIHKNITSYSICVPDFSFAKPVFFIEDSDLPFDSLIKRRAEEYSTNEYSCIRVRSIYYSKKSDFKTYLTFRCINNRSTLDSPKLEHMSSSYFNMETWQEQNAVSA